MDAHPIVIRIARRRPTGIVMSSVEYAALVR
jgi:hypothetical protein